MISRRLRRHAGGFGFALKGLRFVVKTQPNLWLHFLATLLSLGLGFYFGLSKPEWLILVLTIGLVFVAEVFNTALEAVTDALKVHKKTEQDDFYIMVAKDLGAAAVLVAALVAIVVGLMIFGPRVFGLAGVAQ